MKFLTIFLICLSFLFSYDFTLLASEQSQLEIYIEDWNEKKDLASEYLIEAQKAFKNGDELTGCVKEKEAAKYGIEATNSLILANKISSTNNNLDNLEALLEEWYRLRDYC